MNLTALNITPELLKLITEVDEFKGSWIQIGENNPDQLNALRYVATIESIGRLAGQQDKWFNLKNIYILIICV